MKKTKSIKKKEVEIPKTLSYNDKLKLIVGDKKKVNTISTNLQPIKVIPTIFTSFNRAIVAGGAPVRCTYLIHGAPAGGKSILLIAILQSFVRAGHFGMMIDAEYAATKEWYEDLEVSKSGILYEQPDTFEDAIDLVDEKMVNFRRLKKEGILDKDACFAFGVDVIHKLVPKGEMDELRTDRKGGGSQNINKGWGMRRANMISCWLNKLTPIVGKENFAFIALAHEKEEKDSSSWMPKIIIKTKGGTELVYEAMLRIRMKQGKQIYENGVLVGREHIGGIEKNKVGHDKEKFKFFIGNGKGSITKGFDRGLEIYEELSEQKILPVSGAWYDINFSKDDVQRIQGKENVLELFRTNDAVYNYYYKLLMEKINEQRIVI